MFYDDDADLSLLDGKTVAILGYGSQGHAHALNLKDSGVDVVVGLRPDSASVEQARGDGPRGHRHRRRRLARRRRDGPAPRREARRGLARADPRRHRPRQPLLFGHGFSIHYGEVEPPPEVDVALVAPKGPGHLVRRQYLEGSGVPGLDRGPRRTRPARAAARARLRQGHRLHARRRDRDDLQGRDRDRPVRRAGRALRRRVRARPGRLRDARRRRLRPPARVLRVPARAQADRRPDVREGHHRHALLDLQHRRVRRLHARQAHHLRGRRARR